MWSSCLPFIHPGGCMSSNLYKFVVVWLHIFHHRVIVSFTQVQQAHSPSLYFPPSNRQRKWPFAGTHMVSTMTSSTFLSWMVYHLRPTSTYPFLTQEHTTHLSALHVLHSTWPLLSALEHPPPPELIRCRWFLSLLFVLMCIVFPFTSGSSQEYHPISIWAYPVYCRL